jgi:hypothetical protein
MEVITGASVRSIIGIFAYAGMKVAAPAIRIGAALSRGPEDTADLQRCAGLSDACRNVRSHRRVLVLVLGSARHSVAA